MAIWDILFKTLLEPDNIKKIFSDGGMIETLIEKMDKDSIYAICITILALKTNESSTIKAAIEALSKMEEADNENG